MVNRSQFGGHEDGRGFGGSDGSVGSRNTRRGAGSSSLLCYGDVRERRGRRCGFEFGRVEHLPLGRLLELLTTVSLNATRCTLHYLPKHIDFFLAPHGHDLDAFQARRV